MTRRPGPNHHPDDDTNMDEPTRAGLVAEALAVFGHEAAEELARLLRVSLEASQPEAQL
ncbi:hypothetical protein [Methylobacterium sp. E-046]|jgi:hypothetical protein|uniref:hypothetical protein n=1 Tax=Methylobacterium sp. E-046 TaxID=2836576 RepID=UPI001FBA269D|nr:hypothetical protein [Methylobacterium sp. E-046]MCJ2103165.1 hypothetical protein [Methylobacterium sp. E-046]